jgi:CheY-like chemotaxis protein
MKKKVLLIDDDKILCDVTKALLHQTMKYQVTTAQTGEAGIQLARKIMPDVILLDIKMPGMDGGRVAENLGEDASTDSIPIIFFTGLISQDEADRQGGYIGGHPFIAKPFDVKKLTDMIESVTA